ncbi:hypothetical protein MSAN_01571100 [Mycena sanguinolenta]|uniref:Uncharacterized protein n=1 Tax=Mycena sanguinolenta TaxID=230812 RepID=A0A8H6Y3U8_9AGAR|nr:hypothetical protein MSAN_01571100 [Mycena sanguinolenta]
MPLFGSNNNNNKLEKQNPATGFDNTTGYGAGTTGTGIGRTHETYPTTGTGAVGMGDGMSGMGDPSMANPGMGGGRHHVPGTMRTDGMAADQQYGAGTGAGVGNTGIPPASALGSQNQSHSGGGAMTGKIEHAVGSLVGSKSLKAKGIQKEQEARGLKIQSQELAEAERLEHEAGLRRERAVAHGAHPDNRHVGGLGGAAGTGSGPGPYD